MMDELIDFYVANKQNLEQPISVKCRPKTLAKFAEKVPGRKGLRLYRGYLCKAVRKSKLEVMETPL